MIKRGPMYATAEVAQHLNLLSKWALVDIVFDLIRISSGDEERFDADPMSFVKPAVEPVLRIRKGANGND